MGLGLGAGGDRNRALERWLRWPAREMGVGGGELAVGGGSPGGIGSDERTKGNGRRDQKRVVVGEFSEHCDGAAGGGRTVELVGDSGASDVIAEMERVVVLDGTDGTRPARGPAALAAPKPPDMTVMISLLRDTQAVISHAGVSTRSPATLSTSLRGVHRADGRRTIRARASVNAT